MVMANQRPEFRSRDQFEPIRDQYSGHVTYVDQSESRDDQGLGQSQTRPGPVTYYRLEKLNEVSIILTGHHTAQ